MWFKFPSGLSQISVEQQLFKTEAKDENGAEFFRAPDHFAPQILNLGLGFTRADQPKGGPPDLPKAVEQNSDAVDKLALELETERKTLESARVLAHRLSESLEKMTEERDALKIELDDVNKQLAEFKNKESSEKK